MALALGTKLGPYEIEAPLGAGGMGEVYRARDTRLERTVAIKILPAQFSSGPVRKQRFEQEVKTISNLNHPNICVLPDVAYTKMRATAEKALQLDPLSAEAHASMGLVDCRDRTWGEAETAFRRAIQLKPNLPRSRQDFATSVLLPLGRLEEAVRELPIALKLDPLSLNVLNSLDFVLVSAGRYDEVLDNCHRVLTVAPDDIFAEQLSGRALLQKGRLNEAIAIFEKQGESGGPGFLTLSTSS